MQNVREGVSTFVDKNGDTVSLKRGYYWACPIGSPNDVFVVELRGDSILGCGSGFYILVELFVQDYTLLRRVSFRK